MTELQILRQALFDEISRVKRGTSSMDDVMAITKLSNAVIQSYNTEIKGFGLMLQAQEKGANAIPLEIFSQTTLELPKGE